MDTSENKKFGVWGEQVALEYLAGKGYTIIERGFRSRFGEIDLIVKNKEYLVFVEVKTRKNANFANAREFVSAAKQRKIIKTAQYKMMIQPTKLQPRFDVIEIYAAQGTDTEVPEVNHIENAF